MQLRRSGRSGPLPWLVGLAVIVLLAAGALVATRLVDDDSGTTDSSSDPSASPSDDPTESQTDDPSSEPTQGETSSAPPSGTPEGAAALGSEPEDSPAGVPVDQVPGPIVPDPAEADQDLPDLYADDCQLTVDESQLKECAYGVPAARAKATVAVVGDSKAAQWLPALQVLAERYSWRIEVYTKSACPASTVPVSNAGKVYQTCSEFNREVRKRLTEKPVDLVFTVSGRGSAISERDKSGSVKVSDAALSAGLQQTWRVWAKAGSKVLVVSDTPKPVDPDDDTDIFEVPPCVEDHLDDLTACTFDRTRGIDLGGYPTQEKALRSAGARDLTPALRGDEVGRRTAPADISYVDVIPWVCPTDTCPPVIGNVLVYRNGSHLTKTYVETLAPLLDKAFAVIEREPRPSRPAG
ncbi:SGNH hydrolase domain-containing protein [Nocardioides plantarum]|uniref:SGNH hydrolase domain-containing protein n=1 Tax=Nocardioides plantarum TaxID=29299 RepID=A0ABV5KC68_9ACTN|nr:SGNH hydrolase domain-containing protein [Nocardioides plantarum]